MSRRPLYFVVPALLACAIGYLQLRPAASVSAGRKAAAPAQEVASSGRAVALGVAVGERANRARYRLSSEHRASVDGKESASVVVEGTWTTTEHPEGRTEVTFAASRIQAVGDSAPSATDAAAPFVVVKDEGLITSIGFAEGVPNRAKDLLSSLATTFQVTARPGAAWKVEEEDLSGRYEAIYSRVGDTITRKRGRYTASRGPKGLVERRGDSLHAEEESRFLFDDEGLVRATVTITRTVALRKGMPTVTSTLKATLVREDAALVAMSAGPDLVAEAITGHADRAAMTRNRNKALVAGAGAPELIAEARDAARKDRSEPGVDQERSRALRRLSALVQLDGAAADQLAGEIRRDPSDGATVSLLAGALSSAPSAAATSALAGLLDTTMPDAARSTVLANLALAAEPTPDSAAALTKAMDKKPLGDQAALALGAEARTLGADGAGGDAVSLLIQRFQSATTEDDKRTYLQALANTGSTEVLPIMSTVIQGADFDLARVATYGLRLIPGDEVDDELWGIIQSASPLMFQALQAVGYRSVGLWEPRLEAAKVQFKDQKRVMEAIQALISQWGNLKVPAPQ